MRSPMTRRRRLGAATIAMLAAGSFALAACGDDGDDSAADDTTENTAASADNVEFCENVAAVDAAFAAAGPDEPPDPATVGPLLDTVEQSAPEDISADVTAVVTEFKSALSDPASEGPSDEATATLNEIYQWMPENCDATEFAVDAKEYSFEGVPETVAPGVAMVELANNGKEVHELVMVRINDDVDDSLEDIAALPQEEALGKVTPVAVTYADPGSSSFSSANLDEGRYGILCFIPQGATPEAMASDQELAGMPHFMAGMLTEFQVS